MKGGASAGAFKGHVHPEAGAAQDLLLQRGARRIEDRLGPQLRRQALLVAFTLGDEDLRCPRQRRTLLSQKPYRPCPR